MSLKIVINGCPLELFEGATVGDAVRKLSPDILRNVESGKAVVKDPDGNNYYISGELTGGEVFIVENHRTKRLKMKNSKRFILFSIVITLSLLLIGAWLSGSENNETRITIFHLNDIHGNIDNMGKIAHIVDRERAVNPDTFLVQVGDNFSGNPVVDQYEPKGEPLLILMNKMKFNAGTIGNHDFDYGKKVLRSFIERADFPMLCSNIKSNDPEFPQPAPYKSFSLEGGMELVFIGLIQTESHSGLPSTLPANVEGLEFFEGTEYATKYKHLKKENTVLMALSHLGIGEDKKLARKMSEFDVIIGGHSHTLIEHPSEENGVLIVQAGAHLDYLGRIDIVLKNGHVQSRKGSVIELSRINESNKDIDEIVSNFNKNNSLDKVLADIGTTINGRHDLGLMVTDAIREYLSLDIIFYNKGGIRINSLSGNVTVKDVFTMHPFGNYIVDILMDTSEIKGLIKNDFEGHRGLDLIPSGLSYRVTRDLNRKVRKVELFDLNGHPVPEGKKFRVGMNNYIVSSYKFSHRDPGRSTNSKTVDIMITYFSNLKKKLDYSGMVRSEEKIEYSGEVETLGRTSVDIYTAKNKFYGNSSSGNLVADAMRTGSGSDLALFPTRLLRDDLSVERGKEIYREALPDLYSFLSESNVVRVMMTGKQLTDFIFSRTAEQNNIDLQISGGAYTIAYGPGNRVERIDLKLDGQHFDENRTYSVAMIEYDYNNFYSLRKLLSKPETVKRGLADILADHIKGLGTIPEQVGGRRIKLLRDKK